MLAALARGRLGRAAYRRALWLGFLIGFAAEWEDAGRPADDPEPVKERWRGWR